MNINKAWHEYNGGAYIYTTKKAQAKRIAKLLHGRKADYTLKVGKHHALLIHHY